MSVLPQSLLSMWTYRVIFQNLSFLQENVWTSASEDPSCLFAKCPQWTNPLTLAADVFYGRALEELVRYFERKKYSNLFNVLILSLDGIFIFVDYLKHAT